VGSGVPGDDAAARHPPASTPADGARYPDYS